MKTSRIVGISIIFIFFSLVIFLSLPANKYILNTVLHGNVNIDDYKIFQNRVVKSQNYIPWHFSENYNKNQIPVGYRNILTGLQTVAFVVIKDSKLVHESYFKGYDSLSPSNSFSVAKSLVGLLVGCALDDGSIKSLDQPVADYFPEYKTEANKKLTIRNALTMSSGLDWDEQYSSVFSITTKAYYGENLRKLIAHCKVVTTPGKKFKYLSGNTQLLAFIIEKATAKTISEYASEKIWSKIGASQDALWSLDEENGQEKAYCCFNANARDFARIGQLILNKGRWNGKQLVSASYIEELTSPYSNILDEWGKAPLNYYGYQWWITNFKNEKVVYARGILGQYIFVIPSKNLVIVRLGEKRCSLRSGNLPADLFVYLNLGFYLSNTN